MRTDRSFYGLLAIFALAALLAGCETMQPALKAATELGVHTGFVSRDQADSIGKTFQDITPEQEYYIGRSVAATVYGRYRPYNNEKANNYVNLVGQTLAEASDRPETFGGYHFMVLDSPEINAFAAPGGLILVTRGMLKLCKTEDALAAVLAHEIGHVQGRDGLRAIKTGRLTSALTILATQGAKNLGGPQIAQVTEAFEGSISDITSTIMNNGYSRQLEQEADRSAVVILKRVGYNPYALVEMLKEMQKQLKPGGPGFAKTHPDPGDRIKDILPSVGSASSIASVPAARQKRFELAVSGV